MAVVEARGRIMASDVQVIVVDGPAGSADTALEFLADLEAAWSRFLPGSDIHRVNLRPGRATVVESATIALVETMIGAWSLTGGRYNPTILPSLLRTGYVRSIEDPRAASVVDRQATAPCDPSTIVIDEVRSTVTIPVGCAIDPGGIGKGLAADLLTEHLVGLGARGALVCIGGDLVARGASLDPRGWTVGIEHPLHTGSDLGTVTIDQGGIATSSTHARRWTGPVGRSRHHLIDPATGSTARTDVAAVSVVGASGWQAEAHATALAVETTRGFAAYTARHAIEAVAVADDGAVHATAAFGALASVSS